MVPQRETFLTKRISVVVSTYNRADRLDMTLKGLAGQTLSRDLFEVLVVDNNSQDDPQGVVLGYFNVLDIHFSNETRQGLGYVRDTGFRLSRGRYVAFLDDDAIPEEDFLERIFYHIQKEAPDCICGPIYPYYTSPKPSWFKDQYETRRYSETLMMFRPGQVWSGSNMTWERGILERLDGFTLDLGMTGQRIAGGEDTDLFNRYWAIFSGNILYDPDIKVYHWTPSYKMKAVNILKRNLAVGIASVKMEGQVAFFRKVFWVIRLTLEILLIIFISPLLFLKHFNVNQWLVEEMSRAAVRIGKIAEILGMPLKITYNICLVVLLIALVYCAGSSCSLYLQIL